MKVQGTLVQGALALFGLGAAYATWQREPEKAAGEVVVLEATKADLSRIRYQDDKTWVEIARATVDGEAGATVKLSARDAATPGGPRQPERELRGSEAAVKLLASVTPLRATRALGVVEAAKLKEFGLAPADPTDAGAPPPFKKRTVTLTVRGADHSYSVGTPPGLFASYLRDDSDGRVYLLGGTLVSDLESASSRMVDRTLHAWKVGDYDALTVESYGAGPAATHTRELVASAGENQFSNKLAPRKTPDKPDETARNWHDKLFRLFPSELLGKGEKPAAGEPSIALKVTYTSKGKSKGFIELGKLTPPAPAPAAESAAPASPAPATSEIWARTEHTAGWVKLGYGADEVLKEAEKIASAD
jgi:hypothetical protein